METEQAHSSRPLSREPQGRNAAWRDLEPSHFDSQPLGAAQPVPVREGTPIVWLSLLCLDAPLVSVTWLWLFVRTSHTSIPRVSLVVLFLTAWLIYLADRLADARSLPANGARSLRHQFCLQHQSSWIGGLALIGLVDGLMIWNSVSGKVFVAGSVVGVLALIHLLLNYSLGGAWPPLPLKEFAVGSLFSAGTLVPLIPGLRSMPAPSALAAIAFAGVCTLNCLCIAYWEKELDEIQGKVSFATRFPKLERHFQKLILAFAFLSGALAICLRVATPILACVSVSSFLLAGLNSTRAELSRDQRTALADLVLLTPLLAFPVMSA